MPGKSWIVAISSFRKVELKEARVAVSFDSGDVVEFEIADFGMLCNRIFRKA